MPAQRLSAADLAAFGSAARSYWTAAFPLARRELAHWRGQAAEIPDARLRELALRALGKRANMEGAAAFATFAPAGRRASVVRAAVAFQTAYNYLDLLAEQPCGAGVLSAGALHAALPAALQPDAGIGGCYAHLDGLDDGGYLAAMVRACRAATASLPSYERVREAAVRAAERVACFQAFNCGETQGDHLALESWAREQMPADSSLAWWELAGSAGSSLGVHAMLAAAAQQELTAGEVEAIERAYFPWIGALHSMLDQLIDTAEDALTGQSNLVAYYESPTEAAGRLGWLARRAVLSARALAGDGGTRQRARGGLALCAATRARGGLAQRHELTVVAMASMYLSAGSARAPGALVARDAVLRELGALAPAAMAIFRASRLVGGVSIDTDVCACRVGEDAGRDMAIPSHDRHASAVAARPALCGVAQAQ